MIHDTTDGTGKVGNLTFKQLRSLDAGSWKAEQFAGEQIPTFEEILDRYHGKIGILIELKEGNLHKPQNEIIILQSFNFESMKKWTSFSLKCRSVY